MNDLISRRAVLAALTDISYNHCKTEGEAIVIDTAKTLVTVMPSAQPEVAKDTNVPNNDTISRQSAIDAVNNIMPTKEGFLEPSEVLCELMQLPLAQQETCDTCKHGYFGDGHCDNCRVRYPSHYEGRTDERTD